MKRAFILASSFILMLAVAAATAACTSEEGGGKGAVYCGDRDDSCGLGCNTDLLLCEYYPWWCGCTSESNNPVFCGIDLCALSCADDYDSEGAYQKPSNEDPTSEAVEGTDYRLDSGIVSVKGADTIGYDWKQIASLLFSMSQLGLAGDTITLCYTFHYTALSDLASITFRVETSGLFDEKSAEATYDNVGKGEHIAYFELELTIGYLAWGQISGGNENFVNVEISGRVREEITSE